MIYVIVGTSYDAECSWSFPVCASTDRARLEQRVIDLTERQASLRKFRPQYAEMRTRFFTENSNLRTSPPDLSKFPTKEQWKNAMNEWQQQYADHNKQRLARFEQATNDFIQSLNSPFPLTVADLQSDETDYDIEEVEEV